MNKTIKNAWSEIYLSREVSFDHIPSIKKEHDIASLKKEHEETSTTSQKIFPLTIATKRFQH